MKKRTKLVTVESYGKLPELGGLIGPIMTPCYLEMSVVISLINSGKIVYEINPQNSKEKTRLTRTNVLNYIYDYTVNNDIKSTVVKASDVGISSVSVEPSSVKTTIVNDSSNGMTGVDLFISNKYS